MKKESFNSINNSWCKIWIGFCIIHINMGLSRCFMLSYILKWYFVDCNEKNKTGLNSIRMYDIDDKIWRYVMLILIWTSLNYTKKWIRKIFHMKYDIFTLLIFSFHISSCMHLYNISLINQDISKSVKSLV